jgi:hypothetical protein
MERRLLLSVSSAQKFPQDFKNGLGIWGAEDEMGWMRTMADEI